MTASNYPPGVTGNEWQISGPREIPGVSVTCPGCGWQGQVTAYVADGPAYAFCDNPDPVDVDADDHGHSYNVYCAYTDGGRKDGFELPDDEQPLYSDALLGVSEGELRELYGR